MGRSFRWCRQEIAEFCHFDEEHVHVCITTTGYRLIKPRCGRPHINLRFYDLDPEDIRKRKTYADDPVKGEEVASQCMTPAQAQEIVDFVKATPEEKTVVVNCEAGISRSPAVVLAFRAFYGGDTREPYVEAYPNAYVANVLGKILGVGPFKDPPIGELKEDFFS